MNNSIGVTLMTCVAQKLSSSWEMNGRREGIMESRANERKKHAIVYLLGAPLVFWAQLLQKKQINYPGKVRNRENKSDTRPMKGGRTKRTHQQQKISRSSQQEIFTSLFVGKSQVQIHVPPPALQKGFNVFQLMQNSAGTYINHNIFTTEIPRCTAVPNKTKQVLVYRSL